MSIDINFVVHRSIGRHTDSLREFTLFIGSVIEVAREGGPIRDLEHLIQIVTRIEHEIQKAFGFSACIELLNAHDMDEDADEFTDVVLALIKSSHGDYTLQ